MWLSLLASQFCWCLVLSSLPLLYLPHSPPVSSLPSVSVFTSCVSPVVPALFLWTSLPFHFVLHSLSWRCPLLPFVLCFSHLMTIIWVFYLNLFICWTGFMCLIRLFAGTNSVEQSLKSSPALLDFSILMVTFIRIPWPCQYRDMANSLLDIGVEDYPDRDLSVHLGLSGLCSILPCHLIQLPVQHFSPSQRTQHMAAG